MKDLAPLPTPTLGPPAVLPSGLKTELVDLLADLALAAYEKRRTSRADQHVTVVPPRRNDRDAASAQEGLADGS